MLVRHPNVIQFLGTSTMVKEQRQVQYCIITKFMARGSLYALVHDNFYLVDNTPGLRYRMIMDICKGMAYLHGIKPQPIIHRDLNCKNLLLDENLSVVVADLGLSRFKAETGAMSDAVGCLPWVAPEVFKADHYTEKADIYSFAMALFELFTAKEPHEDGPNESNVLKFAQNCAYHEYRPQLPDNCAPAWRRLISKCWNKDPVSRPSFLEILRDITAPEFDQFRAPVPQINMGETTIGTTNTQSDIDSHYIT